MFDFQREDICSRATVETVILTQYLALRVNGPFSFVFFSFLFVCEQGHSKGSHPTLDFTVIIIVIRSSAAGTWAPKTHVLVGTSLQWTPMVV